MDVVTPAGYDTAEFRVYLASTCTVNDVYYVDNPKIYETTKPTNLAEALFGQKQLASTIWPAAVPPLDASKIAAGTLSDARVPTLDGSKIGTGTVAAARIPALATSKITGLDTELSTIDSQIQSAIAAGANLCPNPGFENPTLSSGGLTYSTEQVYAGTYSLKYTASGSTDWRSLFSGSVYLDAQPNDYYYWEMMIFPHTGNNAGSSTGMYFYLRCNDKDGTQVATPGQNINTSALTKGVWQKVSGYLSVGNIPSVVSAKQTLSVQPSEGGNVYYFDNPVLLRVTESVATNQALYQANSPATTVIPGAVPSLDSSKITTGTLGTERVPELPQSKVTNLPTDMAAKLPRETFDAITPGGKNIATDPTMSTASLWQNDAPGTTYAIGNIGYWGIKSLEVTCVTPVSNPSVYFIRNSSGYRAGLIVTPGDKFDFSCYVRAKSGNAGTASANVLVIVTDSTGVNPQQNINFGTAKTPNASSWQKLSTDVTIPAGYDTAEFRCYFGNSTANDKFYVDTPVIRETTAPTNIAEAIFGQKQVAVTIQPNAVPALDSSKISTGTLTDARIPNLAGSKITSGTVAAARIDNLDSSKITTGTLSDARIPALAQSKINGLADSLANLVSATTSSNLCGDPTVANPDYWQNLGATVSLDATVKRSGAQSVKVVSLAATIVYLELLRDPLNGGGIEMPVTAGQRYRAECYMKGHPGNTAPNLARIGISWYDSTGTLSGIPEWTGTFTPNPSAWTHYSYEGVAPAGYDRMRARVVWSSETLDAGNQMWVEDISVTNITEVTNIISTIVAGLDGTGLTLADLATAVENIPGGNIASAILSSIVPSLDASKISTGTLGDSRIPALAQSKITGLVTDLNNTLAAANTAQATIDTRAKDFENLVAGCGFESGSPFSLLTGMSVASDQAHTGDYSLKMVGTIGSNPTYPVNFECQPGDQFYVEFWARRDSAYVITSGSPDGARFRLVRSNGSTFLSVFFKLDQIPTANTWTKITGIGTVPSDVGPYMQIMLYTPPPGTAGTVWLDDIVVRRIKTNDVIGSLDGSKIGSGTVVAARVDNLDSSKITTGTLNDSRIPELAQAKVTGLTDEVARIRAAATSGRNMVTDPSLENTALDSSRAANGNLTSLSNWAYSTAIKHSGTRSLVFTASANNVYGTFYCTPNFGSSADDRIPVTEGQVFYIGQWCYADPANTGTNRIELYGEWSVGTGSIAYTNAVGVNLAPATWTYVSGFITAPAGKDRLRPYMGGIRTGNVAGDKIYVDDLEVYEVSDVAALSESLYGTKYPGSTVQTSVVPALDASKISTGTLGDSRIPSLDAGKVVSGSFGTARIPALDASKVTTGAFGDARIPALDASKIGTGTLSDARVPNLAQSKITGLVTDLGNAQSTADIADVLARSNLTAGSNLATNPGFEVAEFYHGSGVRSSEQKRSGSYSRKITHDGSNHNVVRCITSNTGEVMAPCRPGDVFYCEAWVYGHNSNADAASSIWFQYYWRKDDGTDHSVTTTGFINAGNARKNVWSKMSAIITAPASDVVGLSAFWIVGANTLPNGNVYYLDDVVIREITEAAETNQKLYGAYDPANQVQGNAIPVLDQTKVNNLPADLAARLTAASALNASNLTTGTMSTARIGAGAIDGTKIAGGSITNSLIASGVDAAKLTTGTLPIDRIGSGAITDAKLGSGLSASKLT
ncbi:MAG: hypothetical protein KDK05_07685, partial [Candidatus Competibacteraceae bacterium]|nr:hypothetical protein [Candidatus Competibacteraceae bacterium]